MNRWTMPIPEGKGVLGGRRILEGRGGLGGRGSAVRGVRRREGGGSDGRQRERRKPPSWSPWTEYPVGLTRDQVPAGRDEVRPPSWVNPTTSKLNKVLFTLCSGRFRSVNESQQHLACPPSLRHFVTQGLLPSVVVSGCGLSFCPCVAL